MMSLLQTKPKQQLLGLHPPTPPGLSVHSIQVSNHCINSISFIGSFWPTPPHLNIEQGTAQQENQIVTD
jgi:hypothetical protein